MNRPPYAFVPGHWPHPTRDPRGHRYGQPEPAPLSAEAHRWPADPLWREAITLFDAGFYWEAHETWEAFWLLAPPASSERVLLTALIKSAAAGVKLRLGRRSVARGLLEKASAATNPSDGSILGVDLPRFQCWIEGAQTEIDRADPDPTRPVEVLFPSLAPCFERDEPLSSGGA